MWEGQLKLEETGMGGIAHGRHPAWARAEGRTKVKVLSGEEKEGTKFGDLGEGWDEGSIRRETTN
jgi:hypothetical protein